LIEMIKSGSSYSEQMEFLAENPRILNDDNRGILRQIAKNPQVVDDLLDSLKERYRVFNEAMLKAALELYNADDDPRERILPAIMLFEDAKTIEERRKIILEGGLLLDEAESVIDYWVDATRKSMEQGGRRSMKAVEMLKFHRHAMALPLKSADVNDLQLRIAPLRDELFHQSGTVQDVVPTAVKICRQIAREILTYLDEKLPTTSFMNLYGRLSTFVGRIGELEVLDWYSTAIDPGVVGVIRIEDNGRYQYPTIRIRRTQFTTYLLAHELSHLLVHLNNFDLYDGHSFSAKYNDENEDMLSEVDQMFQDRVVKVAATGSRNFIEELITDTIASFMVLPPSFPLKAELSKFGPPIWGYPGVRALYQTASFSAVRDGVIDKANELGVALTEEEIRKYVTDAGETTIQWVNEHIQTVEKHGEESELSTADIEIAYMWLAFLNRHTDGKVQGVI